MKPKDVHVLCLVKGRERYIFLYDIEHRSEVLRTIGRWACDPGLAMTWWDAAVLAGKVVAKIESGVSHG